MAETRARRAEGGARVPLAAGGAWTAQPEFGASKRKWVSEPPARSWRASGAATAAMGATHTEKLDHTRTREHTRVRSSN